MRIGRLFALGLVVLSHIVLAVAVASAQTNRWWPGFGALNGEIHAMVEYNGDLIAAGEFTHIGTLECNHIARWDGEVWSKLGSGTNETVYALVVHEGDLYAGGSFSKAGGVTTRGIARWDGVSWHGAPWASPGIDQGSVRALEEYQGELIAGGTFTSIGGVAATNIARLGVGWRPLGAGVWDYDGTLGSVRDIEVFDGNLYAAGYFSRAGDIQAVGIADWDGNDWSDVGGSIGSRNRFGGVDGVEIL